ARADVPGPDQLVLFEHAENQGAKVVALPLCIAADHTLVLSNGFYLDPAITAARFVPAVGALRDDAFQLLFPRSLQKILAFLAALRYADHRAWFDDRFEQLSALDQRDSAQVVAVEIKQIEEKQHSGFRAGQGRDRAGIGNHDPRLNQRKTRTAAVVEHADFAVEHGCFRVDEVWKHTQLGILRLAGLSAAGGEAARPVIDEADCAHAVPLDFVQPAAAAGRRSRQHAFHRDNAGRQRRADGSFG